MPPATRAEMMATVSLLSALLLASAFGILAAPALARPWAQPVPLESIPATIVDRVRPMVPNAVPVFAVHTNYRIDASSDTQGRSFFYVAKGHPRHPEQNPLGWEDSLPDAISALGSDGRILWENQVGCNATNAEGLMKLGANGWALVTLGMSDDGDAHYLLMSPDGSIALDDTLESLGQGRVITLSPCGRYYYWYRQGSEEVVLQLVAGGERRLRLPNSPPGLEPSEELPTKVLFLSAELLLAIRFFAAAPPRRVVWDMSVEAPRRIELAPLAGVVQADYHSLIAGDRTPEGDVILYEEWPEEYALKYEVCCYDQQGTLRWHQSPNLQRPSWILAAKDRPIIAVANNTWLTTLDTKTGSVMDTKRLWEEESHASPHRLQVVFEGGRLTMTGLGWDGITPILTTVGVDEDGQISVPEVTTDRVWGLSEDRPVLGAAVPDSSGGWLIVGFRR
jgi:hypothetical protein